MFNLHGCGRYLALGLALISGAAAAAIDPTRPPAAAPRAVSNSGTGATNWRVEAIRVQGQQRVAVINGRMVTEGDRIAGARVAQIETNAVTVVRDGKTERLQLGVPLVKHWSKQD